MGISVCGVDAICNLSYSRCTTIRASSRQVLHVEDYTGSERMAGRGKREGWDWWQLLLAGGT